MRLGAVLGGVAQGFDEFRKDQRAQDQEDFLKDQQGRLKGAQNDLADQQRQNKINAAMAAFKATSSNIGDPRPMGTATTEPFQDTMARYGHTYDTLGGAPTSVDHAQSQLDFMGANPIGGQATTPAAPAVPTEPSVGAPYAGMPTY